MPRGRWKSPKTGKAPRALKKAVKTEYARCRNENPREDRAVKRYCSMRAWRRAKKATGYRKVDGRWVRRG